MTYPAFNLAAPEVTAARGIRIYEAAQRRAIRERELSEARAIQRKHPIETDRQLLEALSNVIASIKGAPGSNMARYREKLTRVACEIEDDITEEV
jgi:hypothetical protein